MPLHEGSQLLCVTDGHTQSERIFSQKAASQGVLEACAADGGPLLQEADSPKRKKAGSLPTAAVRSWAAAEDTSEDDFD